jgi:hypothetical protein
MSDLELEVQRRELPSEVARLRLIVRAQQAERDAQMQPLLDAHIEVYAAAIEALIATHREIGDRTDLDLTGETRWAAMWLLAGRCLAISRVVLHDLRGGFTSEGIGSMRALHEAVQLLSAISFHLEEDAVRRWLAGEWIPPREVREIQGRKQTLADERMRELGIEPEGGDLVQLGRDLYGSLSESAHHQRGGFPESVAPALREFVYGPHPDATKRASHVEYGGHLLEEVVIVVGDAFADMLGRDYFTQVVRPLQELMERVRRESPLSDDG